MIVNKRNCHRAGGCVYLLTGGGELCTCQLRADMNTIINNGRYWITENIHEQIKQALKNQLPTSNRPNPDAGKDTAG